VLSRDHASADAGRRVLIVDLTMPRNVDPALASAPGVTLVDLEGLKEWSNRESATLDDVRATSRRIVDEHADLYEKLAGSLVPGR
jgi:glutamyl-tRNA reductase